MNLRAAYRGFAPCIECNWRQCQAFQALALRSMSAIAVSTPRSAEIFSARLRAFARMRESSVSSSATLSRAGIRCLKGTGAGPTPSPATRRPQKGWSPKKRTDHGGLAGSQSCGRGASATVMHDGGHQWKELIVRCAVEQMHVVGESAAAQPAPSSRQHCTPARHDQRLQNDIDGGHRIRHGHASKSYVHRWGPLRQEGRQCRRGLPSVVVQNQ